MASSTLDLARERLNRAEEDYMVLNNSLLDQSEQKGKPNLDRLIELTERGVRGVQAASKKLEAIRLEQDFVCELERAGRIDREEAQTWLEGLDSATQDALAVLQMRQTILDLTATLRDWHSRY